MKKILSLTIAVLLALSLCACGEKTEPVPTAEPAPAVTEAPAPTAEPAPAITEAPAPTEEPAPAEKTALELAQECVGKSVQELYALIGEPTGGSDYAPSCLGKGEDGRLYYDGFSVDTYREGDHEEVTVVMPD